MFAKKSSVKGSQRRPSETMLGAGAKFEGVLESPANIYIDCAFRGEISCAATVVVNLGALVEATIKADCVVVHGYVAGSVHASERIQVGATGKIKGDVKSASVRVAQGGVLDGNCHITAPDGATPAPKDRPDAPARQKAPAED